MYLNDLCSVVLAPCAANDILTCSHVILVYTVMLPHFNTCKCQRERVSNICCSLQKANLSFDAININICHDFVWNS